VKKLDLNGTGSIINEPIVGTGTPSQQYELYVRDQRIEILEQQNAILQKALELMAEYTAGFDGCPPKAPLVKCRGSQDDGCENCVLKYFIR
jgi:hypothetical protein